MNIQDGYRVPFNPGVAAEMAWEDLNDAAGVLAQEAAQDRLQASYQLAGGEGVRGLFPGRGDNVMTTAEHLAYEEATGESMLPPSPASPQAKSQGTYGVKVGPQGQVYKTQEDLKDQAKMIAGRMFGGDTRKATEFIRNDWTKKGFIIK